MPLLNADVLLCLLTVDFHTYAAFPNMRTPRAAMYEDVLSRINRVLWDVHMAPDPSDKHGATKAMQSDGTNTYV